jgi:hypothetical protein
MHPMKKTNLLSRGLEQSLFQRIDGLEDTANSCHSKPENNQGNKENI